MSSTDIHPCTYSGSAARRVCASRSCSCLSVLCCCHWPVIRLAQTCSALELGTIDEEVKGVGTIVVACPPPVPWHPASSSSRSGVPRSPLAYRVVATASEQACEMGYLRKEACDSFLGPLPLFSAECSCAPRLCVAHSLLLLLCRLLCGWEVSSAKHAASEIYRDQQREACCLRSWSSEFRMTLATLGCHPVCQQLCPDVRRASFC